MTGKDGYIGAVKDKAEAIKGVSPLSSDDFTHIISWRYYSSCKSFKGTSEGPLTPGGGVGKDDSAVLTKAGSSSSLNKQLPDLARVFKYLCCPSFS